MDKQIKTCLSLIEQNALQGTINPIPSKYLHKLSAEKRYLIASFFGYQNFEYCQAPSQDIDYLLIAVGRGNFQLVKYLINECDWDIDVTDKDNNQIFHYAAMFNQLDIFKYFVKNIKNVKDIANKINICNDCHETPFMLALEKGHFEMMEYLLKLSPDLDHLSNTDKNFISYAIKSGKEKIYNYFLLNNKYKKYILETHLIDAITCNNLKLGKYLESEYQYCIEQTNALQENLFMISAKNGNLEAVQYYENKIKDKFKKNKNKDDALFLSLSKESNLPVTIYLIETLNWPVLNNTGFNNHNIVLEAISNKNLTALKYLYSKKCPIKLPKYDFYDNIDNDAFLVSCLRGNEKIIDWVLENLENNVHYTNDFDQNALHSVVSNNSISSDEKIKILRKLKQLDINYEMDGDEDTPLLIADDMSVISEIIDIFDINIYDEKDFNGNNLLMILALNGNYETLKECISFYNTKDFIFHKNDDGQDLLHQSIKSRSLEIVKLVINEWKKYPDKIDSIKNNHDFAKLVEDYFFVAADSCSKDIFIQIENFFQDIEEIEDLRDENKNDCLMRAIIGNNKCCIDSQLRIIKYFIQDHEWELDRKNLDEESIFDLAEDNPDITEYLQNKMISLDWKLQALDLYRKHKYIKIKLTNNIECPACMNKIKNNDIIIKCQESHWCHWDCMVNYAWSNDHLPDGCFMCRQPITYELYKVNISGKTKNIKK